MNNKLSLIALSAVLICSCDQYYVPDNFPTEKFYSYAPYAKNDSLKFMNDLGNDTLTYVVAGVETFYNRGKKTCKCGKEEVSKFLRLSSETETIDIWIDCIDRAIFYVGLRSDQPYGVHASYEVDYSKTYDIWATSYDETMIFKEFTNRITLSHSGIPFAEIKQNEGVLWFCTPNGEKWSAIR